MKEYPDKDTWIVKFLFFSLQKAWSYLKKDGIMAIHIADAKDIQICEPMILYCQWKLEGCKYKGVLGSLGGNEKSSTYLDFSKNIYYNINP